jgi:hypothetical protein
VTQKRKPQISQIFAEKRNLTTEDTEDTEKNIIVFYKTLVLQEDCNRSQFFLYRTEGAVYHSPGKRPGFRNHNTNPRPEGGSITELPFYPALSERL